MRNKRLQLPFVLLVLFSLFLAGCGGEQSEVPEADVEPESTSLPVVEQEVEQEADLPKGKTVTDLKEIEGTWIAAAYPGNFVLTIFPDGRLSVATSLEDLQAGNTDTWQLTMEDGEITATDYALCLGDVGSYVATLRQDGTLRFTSIIDRCDGRLRKMDRSLPGRLNEYILIYNPVE